MLAVSVYVVVEAVRRIGEPVEVQATAMLVVGAVGLAVNVIALLLLRGGAEESLNVKGAYLEVVADAAGSVGVIVAGVLVSRTGEPLWDTLSRWPSASSWQSVGWPSGDRCLPCSDSTSLLGWSPTT